MLSVGALGASASAAAPPKLNGEWINPAAPAAPPYELKTSSDGEALKATWTGAPPHQNLHGTFHGELNAAGSGYEGVLHVTEGSVSVGGTMTWTIDSPDRVTVSYKQDNGAGGTFTLDRNTMGDLHIDVGPNSKNYSPNRATVAWDAKVTICNLLPFQIYPVAVSRYGAYTTMVHESQQGTLPAWYLPGPKSTKGTSNIEPGSCRSFSMRNTTGETLTLPLFDALHKDAKLTLTILPRPGTSTTTTTTTTSKTSTTSTPGAPTTLTLKVNQASSSLNLKSGKVTNSGTYTYGNYQVIPTQTPPGAAVALSVSTNAPLPKGWSITLGWTGAPSYLCQTSTAESCSANETYAAGAPNYTINADIHSPTGVVGVSIIIAADPTCTDGKPASQHGGSCG